MLWVKPSPSGAWQLRGRQGDILRKDFRFQISDFRNQQFPRLAKKFQEGDKPRSSIDLRFYSGFESDQDIYVSHQTAPTGLQKGYGRQPVTESHGLLSQRSYGANKEEAFVLRAYSVDEISSSRGGIGGGNRGD